MLLKASRMNDATARKCMIAALPEGARQIPYAAAPVGATSTKFWPERAENTLTRQKSLYNERLAASAEAESIAEPSGAAWAEIPIAAGA
jgi:hypothetical protein